MNNNKSDTKGVIYYFSGTGNSLFVSKEYESLFEEKNITVDLVDIVDIDVVKSQAKYDFLIIAFPVYAWMPPRNVTDFVKKLPNVQKKKTYILATYRHFSGGSLKYLSNLFLKKGYDVCGLFEYLMPQNFFVKKQEKQQIEDLIQKTKAKIKKDFQKIESEEKHFKKTSFFVYVMSKIVSFFFNIFIISKKNYIVDHNKCTFCGLCEQVCPTKNIIVKKKKRNVIFLDHCLFCTRCYNLCPTKAINFKKSKANYVRYDYFKKYYK